ncbi:type II secretion system protein GspM [Neptuniibacter halophilus]|uniref:type II secretion system protein GspM n=1 Tax=Neptuniibacter halophilus TaxID=651666 RepID=UPI0025725973|nr:type II secretion system protein GspM [Neptuniibacter halophilus]
MNRRWQVWSDKWAGLSKRERGLVLVTVTLAPLALIYVLLLEPALIKLQKLPAELAELETGIRSQQQVLDLLQSQEPVDPNIAARQQLQKLRAELAAADKKIKESTDQLVSPDQMLGLLRSVLTADTGVELVSIKTLGVETMELEPEPTDTQTGSTDPSDQPKAVLYLHPFELELKGSYQGLYNYLQRIEQLDGVFFWDQLDYQVELYPQASIKLRVHTLSSEAGWLGA